MSEITGTETSSASMGEFATCAIDRDKEHPFVEMLRECFPDISERLIQLLFFAYRRRETATFSLGAGKIINLDTKGKLSVFSKKKYFPKIDPPVKEEDRHGLVSSQKRKLSRISFSTQEEILLPRYDKNGF